MSILFCIAKKKTTDKHNVVSKRCIPFNWTPEEFNLVAGYLQLTDLILAIDNIKLLANIQGVGI